MFHGFQLFNQLKMLVINVGIDAEKPLHDGLGNLLEIHGKWFP
jgi:hypothetical protein